MVKSKAVFALLWDARIPYVKSLAKDREDFRDVALEF